MVKLNSSSLGFHLAKMTDEKCNNNSNMPKLEQKPILPYSTVNRRTDSHYPTALERKQPLESATVR